MGAYPVLRHEKPGWPHCYLTDKQEESLPRQHAHLESIETHSYALASTDITIISTAIWARKPHVPISQLLKWRVWWVRALYPVIMAEQAALSCVGSQACFRVIVNPHLTIGYGEQTQISNCHLVFSVRISVVMVLLQAKSHVGSTDPNQMVLTPGTPP